MDVQKWGKGHIVKEQMTFWKQRKGFMYGEIFPPGWWVT